MYAVQTNTRDNIFHPRTFLLFTGPPDVQLGSTIRVDELELVAICVDFEFGVVGVPLYTLTMSRSSLQVRESRFTYRVVQ